MAIKTPAQLKAQSKATYVVNEDWGIAPPEVDTLQADVIDSTFDAIDKKLDKSTEPGTVYAVNKSGVAIMIAYSAAPTASTYPIRGDGGTLKMGDPVQDTDGVNLQTLNRVVGDIGTILDEINGEVV